MAVIVCNCGMVVCEAVCEVVCVCLCALRMCAL